MQKLERYLPGFNHILCGKPPKTTFTQFEEKLRKLRQSTLSELAAVFSDYIPVDMFESKETGKSKGSNAKYKDLSILSYIQLVLRRLRGVEFLRVEGESVARFVRLRRIGQVVACAPELWPQIVAY